MTSYPVMETFYTVQGEGVHTGRAAWFIRLGGCDVGCVWCDVKESWDAEAHSLRTVEELVAPILQTAAKIVVITGGEPAMYDLGPLCDALHANDYLVHIETSGAYPLRGTFDWICCSPKKFKAALSESLVAAHELKVIAYNEHDLQWARGFEHQVTDGCILYIQAEWSKREGMYPRIVAFVKQFPHWRISVQSHHYLGVD